jgi:hypothetical protein
MAKLAGDLASSARNGSRPDVGPAVGDLAERMRGTVTPVIGYLELIAQEGHAAPTGRHLDWITTIERRLEAMRELNDQISRVCDVLRQSVSDRATDSRRGAEAPEG